VPFNQPRMPGKTILPLMLTLYIGAFPPFIIGMVYLEKQLELHPERLALLGLSTACVHAGLGLLRSKSDQVEEELEGYEGEFQLLGLSIE
jgi:hypothetical protein